MKEVRAEILTIGDEILYGQIIDTNSQWIGQQLSKVGIRVVHNTTVGDIDDDILTAFAEAEQRADIILITGGLGPTNDDLTKPCLARYFNCDVEMHEGALRDVTEFFASRGRELTEINRQQAALPVCCEKVTNRLGTAPGMWFHIRDKVFVSMPGVPHEMRTMMSETVIPRLTTLFQTPVINHLVIRTVGIGESFLADRIKPWEDALPAGIKLAYLPGLGEVRLRLTGIGTDSNALREEMEQCARQLRSFAGEYIYGMGEDPLEVAVGKLLRDRNLTLAAAESCTGGYLTHLITSVPGSADYFKGSLIAYSNEVKTLQLGVSPETLAKHGAVSEETIREMAECVRQKLNTDIGVATSGIAGPSGGTPEKPVGTVWIACADEKGTTTKLLKLSKERVLNIKMTSVGALNLIRRSLQ